MSLSKTLYPLRSVGSIEKDPSRYGIITYLYVYQQFIFIKKTFECMRLLEAQDVSNTPRDTQECFLGTIEKSCVLCKSNTVDWHQSTKYI